MATITPTILKDNQKQDGSWNVVYRLTHNRKSRYIKTHHFITSKSLTKDHQLKMDYIIEYLSVEINKYRQIISSMSDIDMMTVDDVKDNLLTDRKDVDMMLFLRSHIEKLIKDGRSSTAKNFITLENTLVDFSGKSLMASKITSIFLNKLEDFIRTPRDVERLIRNDKIVVKKGVFNTDRGVHNFMSTLKTVFNAAKKHYNDEDTGRIIIKNNPFVKYKIIEIKKTRHRNLSVEDIRSIRDLTPSTKQEATAKSMFLLSFYLCGMNMIDIYKNFDILVQAKDRIDYERSKTKVKRKDSAFISIKVPELAKEILSNVTLNYSSIASASMIVSNGLKVISERLKIDDLTFYHARHSFATIARNDCRCRKEDVAAALNHIDQYNKVTDIYIATDWSIIDEVQEAVISKVNEDLQIS